MHKSKNSPNSSFCTWGTQTFSNILCFFVHVKGQYNFNIQMIWYWVLFWVSLNCKVNIVTEKIIGKSQILILDIKLNLLSLVFDYALKDIRISEELYPFLHMRKDCFHKKKYQILVDSSCAWNVFHRARNRSPSCIHTKTYSRN